MTTCALRLLVVATTIDLSADLFGSIQEKLREEKQIHDALLASEMAQVQSGTSPEVYLPGIKSGIESARAELKQKQTEKQNALLNPSYYGSGYTQSLDEEIAVLQYRIQVGQKDVRTLESLKSPKEKAFQSGRPPQPSKSVADQLSPDDAAAATSFLQELGKMIQEVPQDLASKRALQYIFGKSIAEAASGGLDVMEALKSEVPGDGTLTGPVRKWAKKCRKYVADYEKQDAAAQKDIQEQKSIQSQLAYLTPEQQIYARQRLLNLEIEVRANLKDQKTRTPVVSWCRSVRRQADDYLREQGP